MVLLFIYTDKDIKASDQNMLLEMTKMEVNPISMYSLGQYQIVSRNFAKLQSINFNDNENISKEDSMENVNNYQNKADLKKHSGINKSKTEIEMKLKNDQNNKIENVSIYHLITNYRFINNCIQSLLTNA